MGLDEVLHDDAGDGALARVDSGSPAVGLLQRGNTLQADTDKANAV